MLIERLRVALGEEYDVERELAAGGMGVVFLGRERSLDRSIAIKILRPELATAVAAERFQREARMLAAVAHPSVVTIHRVGEAGGLFYFVMERLDGTLADRLANGPLPPSEVVRVATDLLEGLARVHDREIVHRDVKPSNVFLRDDGRAVLGDFGIARSLISSDPSLTATGHYLGTPDYMAPEQFVETGVSPAADIYALGMVGYEALTGRRWKTKGDPLRGDWTGVPGRLRDVLQRALALDPADRWLDARSFARALEATQRTPRARWAVVSSAAVVTAVGLAFIFCPPPPSNVGLDSEVAVLSFPVTGGSADAGQVLSIWVEQNLRRAFGDSGLRVTPTELSTPWFAALGTDSALPASAWMDLHTQRVLRGHVTVRGDSMVVVAELVAPDGSVQPLGRFPRGVDDLMGLGYGIAAEATRAIRGRTSEFKGLAGGNVTAWKALIDAEYAFERDNWAAAETFYQRAIALDSSLAAAWWGLYNVRRWRRAPPEIDLAAVYAQYGGGLGDIEGLLIRAELAATVPERLAIYDTAIARFPYDPYPRLLLGNELFHRGAFAGLGLDSAVAALRSAAKANPYVASTYSMLAWALTRLGDGPGTRAALDAHAGLARAQPEEDFSMGSVLELAWAERFRPPAEAAQARTQVLTSPDGMQSLARAVRLGLSFGLPDAQRDIGQQLERLPDARARVNGLLAQALAHLASGHVDTALRAFDDAAGAAGDPELAFEAAEWRLILPALGLPGIPERDRATARDQLRQLRGGVHAARAEWALLLDGLSRSASDAASHQAALDTLVGAPGLRVLGDALIHAVRGDTARALALTDSLRHYVLVADVEDPLERVVLFLHRGRWLAARNADAADAAWRWYENADLAGWPQGYPQAAELDWAFETFARYERAHLAVVSGNMSRACGLIPEALRRWANADPVYEPLRKDLHAWAAMCPTS
ncbi:MAG: protein kinase [Gemmatimonadota bacterium]|nr:protein kinase [Gemmatimonadota bacterium]